MGDIGGRVGSCAPGAAGSVSVGRRFLKENRLRKRRDFRRVGELGVRLVGRYTIIDVVAGTTGLTRLGITVTKKYGPSHERNEFKRLVREAFRHALPSLPSGLDLNVRPRALARGCSYRQIQRELEILLFRYTKALSKCRAPSGC